MSNGGVDSWSKVIRGRYDFFKLFCQKEKDASELNLGVHDKTKLHKFMEDYSEDLHNIMIRDEFEHWTS